MALSNVRRMRSTIRTGIARQAKLPLPFILSLLPDQSQHTSDDVPNNHLPRLSRNKASPHILYPLDKFIGICSAKRRDDSEKEVCGRNGA